jgi:translation elongation factor P/translation initiation factor 5A
MYARTIMVPAGVMITGALIKIATTLIVSGDCAVFMDNETTELKGYNVLSAEGGRKQAFLAHTDLYMSMLFATNATTVDQAEREFTNEIGLLLSRRGDKPLPELKT